VANNMPRPNYSGVPHGPTLDELAGRAQPITRRPIPGGTDTRPPTADIQNKTPLPPKPKSPFSR
jgi:hypothetical protein